MHVGSAGNADGGCFHSRFQSPFYVQSQVFRQHCERFSKIFRTSKVFRNVWNYYANPNHSELGNHSELSESLRLWVTFLAETSKDLEIILIIIVLSFTNRLSRPSLYLSLNHCDTFGIIPRFRNFFKHGGP